MSCIKAKADKSALHLPGGLPLPKYAFCLFHPERYKQWVMVLHLSLSLLHLRRYRLLP